MRRTRWLISASLLAAAPGGGAAAACTDALDLTEDGTIARWQVCRGSALQTFVAPGGRTLALRVFAEGERIDEGLAWRRDEPRDARRSFRAVDAAHRLDIVREYRRVDDDTLEHTIAVTNASSRALRDVVLVLDPGGPLPQDHSSTGPLAGFFYGFHRAMVTDDGADWRLAEPNREIRAFAQIARHKALIVDSVAPLAVFDAARVRAAPEPDDGGPISRQASGTLLLALGIPELDARGRVVLRQTIAALPTETRALTAAGYEDLTYAHLSPPVAWLSGGIERVLVGLSQIAGPGLAVILLAVGVRLVTLPATLWSARCQSDFAAITERMKPEIARVRLRYDGAEQSERILRIYKENGISPFSGLKGSIGLFLQIPLLLAVFHVTTLSGSLYAEPFLWIDDLSLPDAAARLPAPIPLLGSDFNALPIALGIVFLLAANAGTERRTGPRIAPTLVTLLIVVLVYSVASALLLYWLAANAFQAGERFVFRRARLVRGRA